MDLVIWILITLLLQPVAYRLGSLTGKAHLRWLRDRRRRALIARLEAQMHSEADHLQVLLQSVRDR